MEKSVLFAAVALAILATVAAQIPEDCEQQPPLRECRARLPAWYYNTETGRCQLRQCHNMRSNRWATEEECVQQCAGGARQAAAQQAQQAAGEPEEEGDAICSLPAEIGPCRARFTRYYFDADKGRCRRFYYGGCGGNDNNFSRKSECRERCGGSGRAKGRKQNQGIEGPVDQQ